MLSADDHTHCSYFQRVLLLESSKNSSISLHTNLLLECIQHPTLPTTLSTHRGVLMYVCISGREFEADERYCHPSY